jgi:hypothetical protein
VQIYRADRLKFLLQRQTERNSGRVQRGLAQREHPLWPLRG